LSAAAAALFGRIARRRVLQPRIAAGLALLALLVLARGWVIQAQLPDSARSNQALASWAALGSTLFALAAGWACARAGARLDGEASWLARWPRRPWIARAGLTTAIALYAAAGCAALCAAGALVLVSRAPLVATDAGALPGPDLLLEPEQAAARWQLADPGRRLDAGTQMHLWIEAADGPGARARLRATRAGGTSTELEQWISGGAWLVLATPPGDGELVLELAHVDGRSALWLSSARSRICRAGAGDGAAIGALALRVALGCFALGALAGGFARWMRAPLAAGLAGALGLAALLALPALGSAWRAWLAGLARGVAPAAPGAAELWIALACGMLGALACLPRKERA